MLAKRKAFTLIELLLVIGVLIILIGIVVWGLKGGGTAVAAKATRTTLQNVTNMSEELNRKNKMEGIEGPGSPPAIYSTTPPNDGEFAPANVTSESNNGERKGPAVQRTAEVLHRIASIPDNKRIIEKLPADQVMQVPLADGHENHVVILDGWRNPILFVPATGLHYVASKSQSATASSGVNYSRGARVIAPKQNSPSPNPNVFWTAMNGTSSGPPGAGWFEGIRSPDGRAFWASAGPDGSFIDGDDNIYSFEQ